MSNEHIICSKSKNNINLSEKERVLSNPNELNYSKFSLFKKPILNTIPFSTINILDIYNLIKSYEYQDITKNLRSISDKNEARQFKANYFDYVCFSGVFSQRSNKALIQHSELIVIDFDHLECVEALKELLIVDKELETELLFRSPSGDGLKWVVKIDLSKANHYEYFIGIKNYLKFTYGIDIDGSGKDVTRACFLPHDQDVFINPKYIIHV